MFDQYRDFNSLVEQDSESRRYFASLPDRMKQSVYQNSQSIHSFDNLRDYTESLLESK